MRSTLGWGQGAPAGLGQSSQRPQGSKSPKSLTDSEVGVHLAPLDTWDIRISVW